METIQLHLDEKDSDTILIHVINPKVMGFLHELEKLHLIEVLRKNVAPVKTKLSDKYRGVFSKEDGENLNEHIKQMRGEWESI
ncbi:hypothetical protein Barb4_02642 [Bacteroidales bacterium Barb4]|nr:hypothetical protein Barb4_02642 [Bacteroidales bacterium Barb4]